MYKLKFKKMYLHHVSRNASRILSHEIKKKNLCPKTQNHCKEQHIGSTDTYFLFHRKLYSVSSLPTRTCSGNVHMISFLSNRNLLLYSQFKKDKKCFNWCSWMCSTNHFLSRRKVPLLSVLTFPSLLLDEILVDSLECGQGWILSEDQN